MEKIKKKKKRRDGGRGELRCAYCRPIHQTWHISLIWWKIGEIFDYGMQEINAMRKKKKKSVVFVFLKNQTRVMRDARSNPHGSLRGVEPWPRVTPVRPGGRLDIWIMECSRESQGKQNSLV
ncbi:unnamed protein product, partial [Vitis vinifera]